MLLDALNIPVTANKIAKILAAFDLKNFIFDRVIFAFSKRFASKGNFVGLRVDQSEHLQSPSGQEHRAPKRRANNVGPLRPSHGAKILAVVSFVIILSMSMSQPSPP